MAVIALAAENEMERVQACFFVGGGVFLLFSFVAGRVSTKAKRNQLHVKNDIRKPRNGHTAVGGM